jgi:hypothetical protein
MSMAIPSSTALGSLPAARKPQSTKSATTPTPVRMAISVDAMPRPD